MLNVGDAAPVEMELEDGEGRRVKLAEYLRPGGALVVYFYPADFTPVCTAQACMVRDLTAELEAAGVRVVGISPQGAESKAKFAARHGLTYPVLADPGKRVARAFGVVMLGVFMRRATFVLDEKGMVRERAVADFGVGRHRTLLERLVENRKG